MMDEFRSGTRVLVQRGYMGGREVYTAQPTLREFLGLVPARPETGSIDGREQRLTDEVHAADIGHYVAEVDDYFLPGVMALLHGTPEFEPLQDSQGQVLTDKLGWMWIDAVLGRSLGDGMHRGLGLQRAVGADVEGRLTNDTIVVSFVVEADRDKRRQLFNDINRTQKRVPKSLGVTYDRRDPISLAVNDVVGNHPIGALVEVEKATAGRGAGKLMTTGTLYDAVAVIAYGWSGKPGRRRGAANSEEATAAATLLVDALLSMPAIEAVLDSSNPATASNELRQRSILGSGATVKALAGALYITSAALKDEALVRTALLGLARIDWEPSAWVPVGFVPSGGKTPFSRSQEIRAASQHIASYLRPVVTA